MLTTGVTDPLERVSSVRWRMVWVINPPKSEDSGLRWSQSPLEQLSSMKCKIAVEKNP
jgi:hypothetical protein